MKKLWFVITVILFFSCEVENNSPKFLSESKLQIIELEGLLADRNSEISGLAWYNENLIILPQYPSRFAAGNYGKLFYIPSVDIDDFLNGKSTKILPNEIELITKDLSLLIDGFEGFEAIGISGNEVFLTIEASPSKMIGYLIKGTISNDGTSITLNTNKITAIESQTEINNASEETLIITENAVITIYEANGKNVNPHPVAHVFDKNLNFQKNISFPNIEYRITDATSLENGSFYVINYFWPGDEEAYQPANDELIEKYGIGKTHNQNKNVERILKMDLTDEKILLSEQKPIYLELMGDNNSRNWEGIVRYKNKGFIAATDKFPERILAFIKK